VGKRARRRGVKAPRKRGSRPASSRRGLIQRREDDPTPGRWAEDWERGRASSLRQHPIARLTEAGIDWGVTPGAGDEVGYGMDPYRQDDCLRAAIATCTQVPIEEVPDLQVDKRLSAGQSAEEITRKGWDTIERWALERGWHVVVHEQVPADRDRWVGIVPGSPLVSGSRSAA
jgi:hypothetical protein